VKSWSRRGWLLALGCAPLGGRLGAAGLSVDGLDITGTWTGMIPGKGRRLSTDIAFEFVQQGSKLTGKMYGDGPAAEILAGRIDELGNIRFIVEAREQAGNQINDVRYYFEGLICDGELEMLQERVFMQDAVSGAIIPVTRPDDTPDKDYDRRFRSYVLERMF
jgi:hypothetical protein